MTHISIDANSSRFLKHFLGLAPIATNIITPLVVHYQLKNKLVFPGERKSLVIQEVARQITSGAIGLVAHYGGMWLTGRLLKGSPRKSLIQIIGGTIAQFIGYGFIRPMISTELILQWLKKANLSPMPGSTPLKPLAAEQRMQHFMEAARNRAADPYRSPLGGQSGGHRFRSIA